MIYRYKYIEGDSYQKDMINVYEDGSAVPVVKINEDTFFELLNQRDKLLFINNELEVMELDPCELKNHSELIY